MTTEVEIFEPAVAYERVVGALTGEGWGNTPGDPLTWKPDGAAKNVGLQFSVFIDQPTSRLNIVVRRDGRLADSFSLTTSTGVGITLSLITDMMRAAKEGQTA